MTKKFLFICAIIVLSVNLACAVEDNTKVKVSPAPQKFSKDPATGIEMVYVKGGCYQMGDPYTSADDGQPDEKPVHEVCVDDFYIGKYEVTRGQWNSIMGRIPPSTCHCDADNCPVDNVSWSEVQNFIGSFNKKSGGSKYRLPTEAEFEYAQRSGGKNERYSGGNDVDSVAWYGANSGDVVHPVGTKAPNGLGIYDMSGNVWEWTNDWYEGAYYSHSPRNNPKGASVGSQHTKRGGCASGQPENQRVPRRDSEPDVADPFLGFRLLRIP